MTVQPTPLRQITEDFAVASQLQPMDFAVLKARGVRTVINNRPDDEAGAAYPAARASEALARAHGLEYVHLPVTGLDVTEEDAIAAFRDLLDEHPGPVVAHCASGLRSLILWALGQVPDRSIEDILARADSVGFDLDLILPELEERAARRVRHPAAADSASAPLT